MSANPMATMSAPKLFAAAIYHGHSTRASIADFCSTMNPDKDISRCFGPAATNHWPYWTLEDNTYSITTAGREMVEEEFRGVESTTISSKDDLFKAFVDGLTLPIDSINPRLVNEMRRYVHNESPTVVGLTQEGKKHLAQVLSQSVTMHHPYWIVQCPSIEEAVFVRDPIPEEWLSKAMEILEQEQEADRHLCFEGVTVTFSRDPKPTLLDDGRRKTVVPDPSKDRPEAESVVAMFLRTCQANPPRRRKVTSTDLDQDCFTVASLTAAYPTSTYGDLWFFEEDVSVTGEEWSLAKRLRTVPKPSVDSVQKKWFDTEFARRAGSPYEKAMSLQEEMKEMDFQPKIDEEHAHVQEAIRALEQASDAARALLPVHATLSLR